MFKSIHLEQHGKSRRLRAKKRFIARKKFVVNRRGELPTSAISDSFKENFLAHVETDINAIEMRSHKLLSSLQSPQILGTLGGRRNLAKIGVSLAQAFTYLKRASRDLTYIFFVVNVKGVIVAVSALWFSGGWIIATTPTTSLEMWKPGRRVVVLPHG